MIIAPAFLPMALCLAILFSGCMSLAGTFAEDQETNKVYIGTRYDLRAFDSDSFASHNLPLAIIDLPLSFALDTILLPYTIYITLTAPDKADINQSEDSGEPTEPRQMQNTGSQEFMSVAKRK